MKLNLEQPDWLRDIFNPFWREVRAARNALAALAKLQVEPLKEALTVVGLRLLLLLLETVVGELLRRLGAKAAAEHLLLQFDRIRMANTLPAPADGPTRIPGRDEHDDMN